MTRVEKQLKAGARLAEIELEIATKQNDFAFARKAHKFEIENLALERASLCQAIRTGQGDLFDDSTD